MATAEPQDRTHAGLVAPGRVRRWTLNTLFRMSVLMRDCRGLFARGVGPAPTDVNIEPSNLCNANCVFCGYQYQERPHADLPLESGLAIIEAGRKAGATRLGLTPVVGEPLVHRGLEAFVRAAKTPPNAFTVGLTTNAILLTPARHASLVAAGIDSIDISMSYPDEAEYFRVYRSKALRKVVENLTAILESDAATACAINLSVRTPRENWDDNPLFALAKAKGWNLYRNVFFDDWSGQTSQVMSAEGLLTRPDRAKRLPCAMLFSGPHFFSDGRATACGCRDLDGKSELALDSAALLADMRGVYATGAVEALRARFREGRPPDICASCRHYNPQFGGESLGLRLRQLVADFSGN